MLNPEDLADFLNELLEIDPAAISALARNKVPVNEELAEHPSVVVGQQIDSGGYRTGLIGILNGLTEENGNRVAAVLDEEDSDTVKEFTVYETDPVSWREAFRLHLQSSHSQETVRVEHASVLFEVKLSDLHGDRVRIQADRPSPPLPHWLEEKTYTTSQQRAALDMDFGLVLDEEEFKRLAGEEGTGPLALSEVFKDWINEGHTVSEKDYLVEGLSRAEDPVEVSLIDKKQGTLVCFPPHSPVMSELDRRLGLDGWLVQEAFSLSAIQVHKLADLGEPVTLEEAFTQCASSEERKETFLIDDEEVSDEVFEFEIERLHDEAYEIRWPFEQVHDLVDEIDERASIDPFWDKHIRTEGGITSARVTPEAVFQLSRHVLDEDYEHEMYVSADLVTVSLPEAFDWYLGQNEQQEEKTFLVEDLDVETVEIGIKRTRRSDGHPAYRVSFDSEIRDVVKEKILDHVENRVRHSPFIDTYASSFYLYPESVLEITQKAS